jgi:catechol O-methyltransferase
MMNLGPEKTLILKDLFTKYKPKQILELGGYCGYSSLVFAYLTQAKIHTV